MIEFDVLSEKNLPCAKELKDAAENLAAHKDRGGCYHWKIANVYTNNERYTFAVVLGWNSVGDDEDHDRFYDNGYRLAVKLAAQPSSCIMQCDYDIDWNQPCWNNTGEVFSAETLLFPGDRWKRVAMFMEDCYKIIKKNSAELNLK